jgi:hypothetical protein
MDIPDSNNPGFLNRNKNPFFKLAREPAIKGIESKITILMCLNKIISPKIRQASKKYALPLRIKNNLVK